MILAGQTSNIATGPLFNMVSSMERLPLLRQIGLLIGLAAAVALGVAVVLWAKDPNYQPVLSNLSAADATQASEMLAQNKIPFKLDLDNGVLMVPTESVQDARLKLASSGMTPGDSKGYELLDSQQLGSSQFMETARYYRSVEGELARTIENMVGIHKARVHLAIPRRSVFISDDRKPSASVFVQLGGGRTLDRNQVGAIVHLVSASVPEMSSKDVAVVDQAGHLLSENDMDSETGISARQLEYTQRIEQTYKSRVQSILEPILGPQGFKVQLSADVDFSQVEETAESYNPDQPSLRSEQTLSEEMSSAIIAGIPGALSNQPQAAGSAPEKATSGKSEAGTGKGNARQQATRNYELDRTVSHRKQQVGSLKRLSVAVVADNRLEIVAPSKKQKEPKKNRVPLSAAELARVETLVKDAIGFDAARGDRVSVINQSFIPEEALIEQTVEEPVPIWQKPMVMDLAKQLMGVLLVILLVFGVLRPLLKNMASPPDMSMPEEPLMGMGNDGLGSMDTSMQVTLNPGSEMLLGGPQEGYEEQLTAVKSLISEHPERVAQVVKTWLSEEGNA